jgi:hypothetical protein
LTPATVLRLFRLKVGAVFTRATLTGTLLAEPSNGAACREVAMSDDKPIARNDLVFIVVLFGTYPV